MVVPAVMKLMISLIFLTGLYFPLLADQDLAPFSIF
jgi:hypothetical protein